MANIRKVQSRSTSTGWVCALTRTHKEWLIEVKLQALACHYQALSVVPFAGQDDKNNLIDYPGDVSTPTADLTTTKVLLTSTVSTPGARFMTTDIKNFYLNTPLDRFEYMRLSMALLPNEIIRQYNLHDIAHDGYVYLKLRKGMYGLPQAGILASKRLTKHLATFGYYPTNQTPGLWRHKTRPVTFSLVVDNFGVKYIGRRHAEHLVAALEALYPVITDCHGQLYCGLTLHCDYAAGTIDLSMPGYIPAALCDYTDLIQ
jgi:hypothetical protein